MNNNNGKTKRDVRIGMQVPAALALHLSELAAAESISTGRRVTISSLCRRAIMERFRYGSCKVVVTETSDVEQAATWGLFHLAK